MKVFHCDHCGALLFFENVECVSCGHLLAYVADLGALVSLDPMGDGTWTSPMGRAKGQRFRLCDNYRVHNVCNWAVSADDLASLCDACRLTLKIPDLTRPQNKVHWYKLEVAKRRLIYLLEKLRLPLKNRSDDPVRGLGFEFLADPEPGIVGATPVLTGHADGIITVNLAEADDAEREKRRCLFNEPYRTLLGHFRHEIGHYYWELLIKDSPLLDGCRALFGDDRQDYAEALKRYYAQGAAGDWQKQFVSTYATAHAWEDWAETWAHYLHMVDTLETASACGMSLRPRRRDEPNVTSVPNPVVDSSVSFDTLMDSWTPITYALNNLNRGLGVGDAYPFVLSTPAIQKLRFVHDTIASVTEAPPVAATVPQ
ncbi:MAG: putative zinc-binding peptidase [Burkholderiales bacterium]|nr:putative zinc-binding peptidase [Phycisphaerae bacterium]